MAYSLSSISVFKEILIYRPMMDMLMVKISMISSGKWRYISVSGDKKVRKKVYFARMKIINHALEWWESSMEYESIK